MFNDFDSQIQPEEFYTEDFSNVCPDCGTDHSNPDDETACLADQEARDIMRDRIEYEDDMDGDHESGLASAGWGTDEDYHYGSWQDESDLGHEF